MSAGWFPPRNRATNVSSYTTPSGEIIYGYASATNVNSSNFNPTVPYQRVYGLAGQTYTDFQTTPTTQYLKFRMSTTQIFATGFLISSWTEGNGLVTRAFGGLPTKFKLYASNDDTNWTQLFDQSIRLTNKMLTDSKFNVVNDNLTSPVIDYDMYDSVTDNVAKKIEDVYYQSFPETAIKYSWFKLEFNSLEDPDHRIRFQYDGTTPTFLLPPNNMMRISNFAVYGSTTQTSIIYKTPTTQKQIIDFAMDITQFNSNIVATSLDGGVSVLTANIAPDQYSLAGQFGLFQFVSVPSLNKAYIRVAKVGTNLGTLVNNTAYRLKLNLYPANNSKDLTYTDGGLIYRNNVYDDEFRYFEVQPTFSVVGFPPIADSGQLWHQPSIC